MVRPRNLAGDGEPDAAALAAACAYGIAGVHPFVDSNKRLAVAIAETFVTPNDYQLVASDAEVVVAFLCAAGELSEDKIADWLRQRIAVPDDIVQP